MSPGGYSGSRTGRRRKPRGRRESGSDSVASQSGDDLSTTASFATASRTGSGDSLSKTGDSSNINIKENTSNNNMPSDSSSTVAALFRAKTAAMKTWKPRNTPSSRDRLELYALHKQAASGDAPMSLPSAATAASSDVAKYNAWKTKRGISQEEAMNFYVLECDRQLRTYGTKMEGAVIEPNPQTPTNTPSAEQTTEGGSGSFKTAVNNPTTPRGLEAVPLLCAAATETRQAYISRLRSTSEAEGWWSKQEALCADPKSLLATPERFLIQIAQWVEAFGLYLQSPSSVLKEYVPFISPSVLQAILWPLHNVLLALWIWMIVCCTSVGSVASTANTILFGSKITGVSLEDVYSLEVVPTGDVCQSLCDSHQALSVRLVGLALWPWNVTALQTTTWVVDSIGAGLLPALTVYAIMALFSWWYWFLVLPWLAAWAIGISLGVGVGFGLIELAGM